MDIQAELSSRIPKERIRVRYIDRIAYASDASYFHLVPEAVVQPASIDEVCALFNFSRRHQIPLVFRAAGTSLSGQAVTDGILVDISKHWTNYQVSDGGDEVLFQPGIVGGFLNNALKSRRRRLGPDPASIDAAMMGGILANNSSGMCCGVTENAYRTIKSMTVVLPNGYKLDTGAVDAEDQIWAGAPDIAMGLLELRARLLAAPADSTHPDEALAERVRRRYQMKNNNGYSLNAFVDFEKPLDILTHLLIGSEGTLGFIAEATLRTLPEFSKKYTGLLHFANIHQAASAIYPLNQSGARAIEIMDRASLRSIENLPGAPSILKDLPESAASILVEYQAGTDDDLHALKTSCKRALSEIRNLQDSFHEYDHSGSFTEDPCQQSELWKLRKGIIPSVGAMRAPQTTLLTEDVLFPVPRLADAVSDLQDLFDKHGYSDAVIFGHAKDGNLHFLLAQSFGSDEEIQRFDKFTHDMVDLVSGKYDGALKAEHGTGRNMTPFVEAEWGATAYGIMRDLKSLFDPDGLLGPGVIINDNPHAHLLHTKSIHPVGLEVDKCIECGFCESKCPSRWLTMTPRQRIVVQREISQLRATIQTSRQLDALIDDFSYDGIDTCALDGLCATACPVGINTGELIRKFRAEAASPSANSVAKWVGDNFSFVEKSVGRLVQAGHVVEKVLGDRNLAAVSSTIEIITRSRVPKWNTNIPNRPGGHSNHQENTDFIYFPSCISRQLGQPTHSDGSAEESLVATLMKVSERAGLSLSVPDDVVGICCGMPFNSKGYHLAYQAALHKILGKFWTWSQKGNKTIVVDTTSCLHSLRTSMESFPDMGALSSDDLDIGRKVKIIDSIEFIHDALLPRLNVKPLAEDVVLHPNCSARKLGLDSKLVSIAQKCARSATVPLNLGCCAFAGDRGLLYPELTNSATRAEAAEVCSHSYGGYYSSNLPCEIGMSAATGEAYVGIVYLVERATR
jgi:D-lactate dehydrogenase